MFSQVIAVVLLVAGVRGQGAVSYSVNHDSSSIGARVPVAASDSNVLTVTGSRTSTGALSTGLGFENIAGHGLFLSRTRVPDFGSQLSAAGKLNLLNYNNHKLDANAFVTKNMPNIPNMSVPNFNTVGGGLNYMYNNRVGASVGSAHTPFLHNTDYSAMGKVNLFDTPKASLDFNAGFSKSVSPFKSTGWQPAAGVEFRRYFNFGR